jgi:hypothetical protein
MQALAHFEPLRRRLVARENSLLARLGVYELLLETHDVVAELVEPVTDRRVLVTQRLGDGRDARLLGKRRLGQVLAFFVERKLRFGLPLARFLIQAI